VPYADNPANSLADRVRLYVGDTNAAAEQLTDSEVDFLLEDERDDPLRAAARAAEILAAKYASQAEEKRVGPLTLANRRQSQADRYRQLAKALWSRASSGVAAPFAGGISQSDKETRENDGDRVPPIFRRDMMEYVSDEEELRP
jgi:cell division septum initiation protein DivIVA